MSVEAVLLVPLLVVLMLFIVHIGRLGTTKLRLVTIADQAARMASQVRHENMEHVAKASASANVSADGLACEKFEAAVTITRSTEPQTVSVSLVCELSRQGLALLAPLPRQIQATSTEVIDRWRADP